MECLNAESTDPCGVEHTCCWRGRRSRACRVGSIWKPDDVESNQHILGILWCSNRRTLSKHWPNKCRRVVQI